MNNLIYFQFVVYFFIIYFYSVFLFIIFIFKFDEGIFYNVIIFIISNTF